MLYSLSEIRVEHHHEREAISLSLGLVAVVGEISAHLHPVFATLNRILSGDDVFKSTF